MIIIVINGREQRHARIVARVKYIVVRLRHIERWRRLLSCKLHSRTYITHVYVCVCVCVEHVRAYITTEEGRNEKNKWSAASSTTEFARTMRRRPFSARVLGCRDVTVTGDILGAEVYATFTIHVYRSYIDHVYDMCRSVWDTTF